MDTLSRTSCSKWLITLTEIYSFTAKQKWLEPADMIFSHHNGKDQIMLQVRHQGDQQNLIQFQIEALKACSISSVKKFVQDEMLTIQQTTDGSDFQLTVDSYDPSSGLKIRTAATSNKIQEEEIVCDKTNALKIDLKLSMKENEAAELIDNFETFLRLHYLIERQDSTMLDFIIGDASSKNVFRNDVSKGFINVGGCRFVGNLVPYVSWNPVMALTRSVKLDFILSRSMKIPGSSFNLILACAKYMKDENSSYRNPVLTILSFSAEKFHFLAMTAIERKFFLKFIEKIKKCCRDVGINLNENCNGNCGMVFEVATHLNFRRNICPEDTLLILSVQNSKKTDDAFPIIDVDASWNDNIIKWLLPKLANGYKLPRKKVSVRTKEQFQQVVEGICRSFTDIVENTDRKRFKKLCLDITQSKTAKEFGNKIHSYLTGYTKVRYSNFTEGKAAPMNDFNSLESQQFLGAETVKTGQIRFNLTSLSRQNHQHQCSTAVGFGARSSSIARSKKTARNVNSSAAEWKPKPKCRKKNDKVYDNLLSIARPQKEISTTGNLSASEMQSILNHGILMETTVVDGQQLPQTMFIQQTAQQSGAQSNAGVQYLKGTHKERDAREQIQQMQPNLIPKPKQLDQRNQHQQQHQQKQNQQQHQQQQYQQQHQQQQHQQQHQQQQHQQQQQLGNRQRQQQQHEYETSSCPEQQASKGQLIGYSLQQKVDKAATQKQQQIIQRPLFYQQKEKTERNILQQQPQQIPKQTCSDTKLFTLTNNSFFDSPKRRSSTPMRSFSATRFESQKQSVSEVPPETSNSLAQGKEDFASRSMLLSSDQFEEFLDNDDPALTTLIDYLESATNEDKQDLALSISASLDDCDSNASKSSWSSLQSSNSAMASLDGSPHCTDVSSMSLNAIGYAAEEFQQQGNSALMRTASDAVVASQAMCLNSSSLGVNSDVCALSAGNNVLPSPLLLQGMNTNVKSDVDPPQKRRHEPNLFELPSLSRVHSVYGANNQVEKKRKFKKNSPNDLNAQANEVFDMEELTDLRLLLDSPKKELDFDMLMFEGYDSAPHAWK